jgi:hypothetical protein
VIAVPAPDVAGDSPEVPDKWIMIHAAAPLLVATMLAYLAQITVSMRPSTVRATETDLRILAGFLIDHDPALSGAGDIDRSHIEAFKLWQRAQPGDTGATVQGVVVPAAHVDASHVLHPHRRVGLGRRPSQGADPVR